MNGERDERRGEGKRVEKFEHSSGLEGGEGGKTSMYVRHVQALKWVIKWKNNTPKKWMTTIISQADTWVNTDGHDNERLSCPLTTTQKNRTVWRMGWHCQHIRFHLFFPLVWNNLKFPRDFFLWREHKPGVNSINYDRELHNCAVI